MTSSIVHTEDPIECQISEMQASRMRVSTHPLPHASTAGGYSRLTQRRILFPETFILRVLKIDGHVCMDDKWADG